MQPVIYPVNKAKLLAELTEERFIRKTNKGGNEIYSFNAFNSPNLMKEVGRLRELTFRTAGGGTGKEVDIDPFDVDEQVPYQQLIVWDPKEQEILGGYRYILCDNLPLNQEGEPNLATTELFRFSEAFKKQYLTKMISWGVLSYNLCTNLQKWDANPCSPWITCGTVWALLPWRIRVWNTSSGK